MATAYTIEHITYDVRCGKCSGFRISGLDQQSAKDEAAVHNARHHAVERLSSARQALAEAPGPGGDWLTNQGAVFADEIYAWWNDPDRTDDLESAWPGIVRRALTPMTPLAEGDDDG